MLEDQGSGDQGSPESGLSGFSEFAPGSAEEFSLPVISRELVGELMDMVLPAMSAAAAKTETLVDDAVVDMIFALHKSDLAKEWLAGQLNSDIPDGALAISTMSEAVKQDIFRHLPGPRQEEFGAVGQAILKRAIELFLPIALEMLRKWITKIPQ